MDVFGLWWLYLKSTRSPAKLRITKKSCPKLTRLDLSSNPTSQVAFDRIREELAGFVVTADDLLPAPDLKVGPSLH